jgi:MFS family permease
LSGEADVTLPGPRRANWLWFWLLSALLTSLLFAASAPSPLYSVYAARWNFPASTLTLVYAVYAFGALGALLLTGRLSDHVGRRPVSLIGLAVQVAGMAAFIVADGVEALYAGRILQGIGTGMGIGAISAWLLDLQPPDTPGLGSLVAGLAPLAGLATGAFGAGLLVQFGPDPLHLVFWLLTVVYVLGFVAISRAPDPAVRLPGWLQSMRPRVSVPRSARAPFVATTPSQIATWAIAALYLSLGPSLAVLLLGSDSRVAGGLVILALLGTGVLASAAGRHVDPRLLLIRGSALLGVGVAMTLISVAASSPVGLYAGSAVAGLGLGPAFSGTIRLLGPLAPAEQRGALFAAIYLVLYLSLSVPAIAAGIAVTQFGLRDTTYVYGLAAITLAVATTVAVWRQRPRTGDAVVPASRPN